MLLVAQRSDAVRRYIEESGLGLNILVDESRDVLRAYGIWQRAGLTSWNIARPALFLVDQERNVQYSFVADRQHEFPARDEILAAIDQMRFKTQ